MRPLLPSVALVTAMFLLGCQEQGSPVVAVDLSSSLAFLYSGFLRHR